MPWDPLVCSMRKKMQGFWLLPSCSGSGAGRLLSPDGDGLAWPGGACGSALWLCMWKRMGFRISIETSQGGCWRHLLPWEIIKGSGKPDPAVLASGGAGEEARCCAHARCCRDCGGRGAPHCALMRCSVLGQNDQTRACLMHVLFSYCYLTFSHFICKNFE